MCGKAARLEDPVTVRWHNPIWTMVRMRGVSLVIYNGSKGGIRPAVAAPRERARRLILSTYLCRLWLEEDRHSHCRVLAGKAVQKAIIQS